MPTPRRSPGARVGRRVPVRVQSVPAAHSYAQRIRSVGVDAVQPRVVHLPDPTVAGAPPGRWWPPPALEADWVRRHGGEVDVMHLHFGFDASSPESLRRWVAAMRDTRTPFVLTVHDVVNPHFVEQSAHLDRLDVLVPAAAALVTLTEGAARDIRRRWHRDVTVVPHPHVAPLHLVGMARAQPSERFVVGLHLKSLRANVVAAPIVRALSLAVADLPGAEVVVHAHHDAFDPAHPRHDAELVGTLSGLESRGGVRVVRHDRHTDAKLWTYLRATDLSVMPYAFGTHSGWIEACHDLGTTVLAPRTGRWVEQQRALTFGWPTGHLPDADELVDGVRRAHQERPAWQAARNSRRAEQGAIGQWHDELYVALAGTAARRGRDLRLEEEVGA